MGHAYSYQVEKIVCKKNGRLDDSVDVSSYTKLREVYYRKSNIELIPAAISQSLIDYPPIVDTLTELSLIECNLLSIPDEVCHLVNLKRLCLERNKLRSLPLELARLYKLERLLLSRNCLEFLPPNIRNMKSLIVLELHKNDLRFIPNDIGEMYWLEELSIEDNDSLDDDFNLIGNLSQVLMHIMSGQTILRRYKEQHIEYLTFIKDLKKKTNILDGIHELNSDQRMLGFIYLLSKKLYRDEFFKFLQKEYASESLLFYEDTVQFRERFYSDYRLNTKELYECAKVVYEKYINPEVENDAVLINIPSDVKNKLVKAFSDMQVDQFIFTESKIYILRLMLNDNFSRFIESEGKEIWSKIQGKFSTS